MMKRRDLLVGASVATALSVLRPGLIAAQTTNRSPSIEGNAIYVNPATGVDTNSGSQSSPLKTLAEAARRMNQSEGSGAVTIVLSRGIYAVGESMLLKPQKRSFSASDRLTIRAEFLPDDPEWTTDKMPTLIFTMPFPNPPTWNGRPDGGGEAADGILVETSHVSILGLKFLGLPVLEEPKAGFTRRLYGINRNNRELEDLEIGHCMFLGDIVTNPIHVAIIANGGGMNIHHSIFRGNKITAVYWQPGTKGHAMRNCLITGCYGSGIWTASIADDFKFENNVMDDCRYAWTYQNAAPAPPFIYNPDGTQSKVPVPARGGAGADAAAEGAGRGANPPAAAGRGPIIIPSGERVHYKVANSHFGKNQALAGSGTGASLGYVKIDSNFMDMVGTKVTNQPVLIEMDQTKRNYLHPVSGSDAAKIGAGLFTKTA